MLCFPSSRKEDLSDLSAVQAVMPEWMAEPLSRRLVHRRLKACSPELQPITFGSPETVHSTPLTREASSS